MYYIMFNINKYVSFYKLLTQNWNKVYNYLSAILDVPKPATFWPDNGKYLHLDKFLLMGKINSSSHFLDG